MPIVSLNFLMRMEISMMNQIIPIKKIVEKMEPIIILIIIQITLVVGTKIQGKIKRAKVVIILILMQMVQ